MKAARVVIVLTAALVAWAAALPAATAQVSEEEYVATLGDLAVRMAALGTQAGDVNGAWDAREVSLDDTVDAFASIQSQVDAVVQETRLLTPPDDLGPQHAAMVTAAEEALAAAQAMIAGLNDPNDAGDARRAATDQFAAAAAEFVDIASLVTAPPATTTTTTLPATTSTTSSTVAAVTTSPPVTAALPTSTVPLAAESGGGGDVETPLLVLIGLLAGLLVGITGGLLIGRRARRNLIDALQRERAGGAPPAA